MCDRGGRKLINLSSFLSGQGEIKMDTSTEKHNFEIRERRGYLRAVVYLEDTEYLIRSGTNLSAFQNGEKRYSGVSQEDAKGRIS